MHSIQIITIENAHSPLEGSVAVVTTEVVCGDKHLGIRKFSYPLTVTQDEIVADLEKYKNTLDSDYKVAEENAELEKGLVNVEDLKKSLTNYKI